LNIYESTNNRRLVIEYKHLAGITKSKYRLSIIIDADTQKHGYREGLVNLVVHAVTYEY